MCENHRSAVPTAEGGWREMNTVGIFAGRGDTILVMGFALVIGIWVGWQLHRLVQWIKRQ